MKDPQLIDLFKSLSEKELIEFRKFLNSPFHNTSATVTKLYSILRKYYPQFSPPDYTKENVFEELFPGKKYNSLLLNEYFYLLSNLIVEFIKQIVSKKNEIEFNIELLNEYRIRGLKNNFDKLYKKIGAKISSGKYDYSVLTAFYYLNTAKNNFTPTLTKKETRTEEINQKYNLHLTYLFNIIVEEYLTTLLSYRNEISSHNIKDSSIFQKLEKDKVIYKLYEYVKEYNPFDFNIRLHISMIEMLEHPDQVEKYYQNKKAVLKDFNKFSNNELDHLINYLKSFCIFKTHSSESRKEFLEEYVELEFLVMKEKIFLNDETSYFNSGSFRNLLITFVNLKETQRIKDLIEYSKYLSPETRIDLKNLASAYYYFLTGSFEEARKYLKRVVTYDKQIELDAGNLSLKIYYEQKNVLKGIEKIHSVRGAVKNAKGLSEDRKKMYRSFLNYLEKLFLRMEKDDEAGIVTLLREIVKKKDTILIEWFEEKLVEFSGKKKR